MFRARLAAGTFAFALVTPSTAAASTYASDYGALMRAECTKYGMKPVCDQDKYCDSASIGIGNEYSLTSVAYHTNIQFQEGIKPYISQWAGRCAYRKNATRAYCSVSSSLYARSMFPRDYNPGFFCAVRVVAPPPTSGCEFAARLLRSGTNTPQFNVTLGI